MNTTNSSTEASAIEKFPHVVQRICMIWSSPELDLYLNKLLTDSRDGQRKGFPVEVTAELLFLAELNKMSRAIDIARKLKIPLRDAYQKVDSHDRGKDEADHSDDPLIAQAHDQFARPDKEFAPESRQTAAEKKKEGVTVKIGQGVFAVMSSKILLFAILLFIAYKLLTTYVFKM